MTLEQKLEYEQAIQLHIQQAVSATIANIPPLLDTLAVNINAVVVKLPEYWTADPNTWCSQTEAAFRRSNIIMLYTKYDHVLIKCNLVMFVRDLLNSMQPNTPDAYEQ
jgi:hypothetical protein